MKKKTLLWITDPWETLDHPKDTTLRLAQAAFELGIPQAWCDVHSIRLDGEKVLLDAKPIHAIAPARDLNAFQWGPMETKSPQEFSTLHYRTDPPVSLAYLHPLHLLALGLKGTPRCEVINPIEVLFSLNEKTEAALLKDLLPPSLVSSQREHFVKFGKSYALTVLKPLHEAQSHGVALLDWRTPEEIEKSETKLAQATQNFSTPVILQKYMEEIVEGEIRLWFVDGNLLAAIRKLPQVGDFRVNIDAGSQLAPVELTLQDKKRASTIGKHLRSRKIRLAAVDLIAGYITDFNFTSPGLITQMEAILGENLAKKIMIGLAG